MLRVVSHIVWLTNRLIHHDRSGTSILQWEADEMFEYDPALLARSSYRLSLRMAGRFASSVEMLRIQPAGARGA
jgi:hypothetical protein